MNLKINENTELFKLLNPDDKEKLRIKKKLLQEMQMKILIFRKKD